MVWSRVGGRGAGGVGWGGGVAGEELSRVENVLQATDLSWSLRRVRAAVWLGESYCPEDTGQVPILFCTYWPYNSGHPTHLLCKMGSVMNTQGKK